MKKRKKPDKLKVMKKIARENQLQQESEVGRVRAKSWGGKDSPQKARKKWKPDDEQ